MLDGIMAIEEVEARMMLQIVESFDIAQAMRIREFIYAGNNVVYFISQILAHGTIVSNFSFRESDV